MALPILPSKDTYDVVTYSADFSALLVIGDTIASAQVVGTPTGLTIGNPVITFNVVSAVVSGGVLGSNYELAFEITTTGGLSFKRSGIVAVRDR